MEKWLVSFFLLIHFTTGAQSPVLPDELGARFSDVRRREFQEKVYLHTDKESYVSGEHIWFRAYRTDASTHLPSVYSRFIYVELYNEREELVDRLKVMEKDGVFHGSLFLDRYLASGRYCLRAYTYWMQNFDDAFYFEKKIRVENMQVPGMRRDIRWKETDKGERYLEFRFVGPDGNVYPRCYLDCRMYKGSRQVNKLTRYTDADGWVRYPLRVKDSVTSFRIQFLDKKPVEYQTVFSVPLSGDSLVPDVRFFPEGGYLLAGVRCQVNFKAVGPDGYGREVYGCIYGSGDRLVTAFSSSHLGMGRFELDVLPGEHYYALVHLPGGMEQRVDLPEAKDRGVVLHAELCDSVLRYSCLSAQGYFPDRGLYLLVHSRGKLVSVAEVGPGWSGTLSLSDLPCGIVQGVLVDAEGEVYSSRMSFVYPRERGTVSVGLKSEEYGKRDSVLFSLCYSGLDSVSCSVSVTDSLLAPLARNGSNIVNYFLLSSDLKGHIECPGWYFDPSLPLRYRERMLDILLGTQGWERFDVGRSCRGEGTRLPFFLELSQGISGEVRNFWGKSAKNPKLFAVAPNITLMEEVKVDTNGRFELNVEFPKGTTFVFQALTSRHSKWVELYLDEDSLRPPQKRLYEREYLHQEDSVVFEELEEYGTVKDRGYYYDEGRKVYLLEEAKAVGKKDSTYLGQFEHIAEQILEARDIRDEKIKSLEEWVTKIPGVSIESINGRRKILYGLKKFLYASEELKDDNPNTGRLVHVYVNDFDIAEVCNKLQLDVVNMLNVIPLDSIIRIGYVRESGFGDRIDENLTLDIFIYLNFAYDFYSGPNRVDFMKCTPLGYHEPAEFYQPKYEVEEERLDFEPDERSTLYWNPAVRLSSGDREKLLRFYTSDTGGPYRIVVEGITSKGEIVRTERIIK